MTAIQRSKAKYQTQFDIDIGELDIIEKALRHQADSLYQKTYDQQEQEDALNEAQYKSRMTEIQSVLGKLHNQKIWFVPNGQVPLG